MDSCHFGGTGRDEQRADRYENVDERHDDCGVRAHHSVPEYWREREDTDHD